ncbi:AAA family ATPase [Candidatus Woesearchaeota archaeon]|nr:AAA family ATPase [Candidatus Woesearchaeota archaeon]
MVKELKLKVAESVQDDVNKGIVRVDTGFMHEIGVRPGDFVEIEGSRKTVGIADRAYPGDIGLDLIRMDGLVRRNAKTGIGEIVKITKADVKEAKKLIIAPARRGIMIRANPEVFKQGLLGRALVKGDIVALGGTTRRRSTLSHSPFEDIFRMLDEDIMGGFGFGDIKFVVVDTLPKQAVIVTDLTEVVFNPEAAETIEEQRFDITYEDIGGLNDEVKKIREMVELPLKHPEIFERLGIEAPKGVLLHGPPGTGKTLVAKAVANETNSHFIVINGPEIMCVGGDTKIMTNPHGDLKAKDIYQQKGRRKQVSGYEVNELAEPIKTYGFKDGKVVKTKITHAAKLRASAYRVKMDDKTSFITSSNQPFLIYEQGKYDWKPVRSLRAGDSVTKLKSLATKKLALQRIKEIKSIGESALYDFTARHDSFLAGLYLLHNSKFYGQSEQNLRKKFEEAEKNAPAIVFIDEIDAIATRREEVRGEVERRVVAQLLALMDGLKSRGKVVVIAATNVPNLLDPALRRPGRFDREIEISVPSKEGRLDILKIHTRNMPLSKNVSLKEIAAVTHGFVGADVAMLAKEAAMVVLRRVLPDLRLDEEEPIPKEILEKMQITKKDFKDALKFVRPSAMREVLVEVPNVKWSDIGGLEEMKQELKEAVEWPIKSPEAFRRLGVKPPKGLLLYGAPGTGKTMLAKAVATESEANFILVNGPELFSKWVGDSEKAVREVFKKARQTSPTIIFFDEIDSLAPRRGTSSDTNVTERVVNQLLTEMDGLEDLYDIVVIAATNRPDMVDPALLRPGRFDRMVLAPVPDEKARLEIFKVHTQNMPINYKSLSKDYTPGKAVNEILSKMAADNAISDKDAKKKPAATDFSKLSDEDKFLYSLAERTEGYVGADIEAVCREAAIFALRKDFSAKEVEEKHFAEALNKIRPSVTKEIQEAYEMIRESFATARAKELREEKPSYMG